MYPDRAAPSGGDEPAVIGLFGDGNIVQRCKVISRD